jgi:hypothetical protein
MLGWGAMDGLSDGVTVLPAARSLPEWFDHAPCPYQLRPGDGLQVLNRLQTSAVRMVLAMGV